MSGLHNQTVNYIVYIWRHECAVFLSVVVRMWLWESGDKENVINLDRIFFYINGWAEQKPQFCRLAIYTRLCVSECDIYFF